MDIEAEPSRVDSSFWNKIVVQSLVIEKIVNDRRFVISFAHQIFNEYFANCKTNPNAFVFLSECFPLLQCLQCFQLLCSVCQKIQFMSSHKSLDICKAISSTVYQFRLKMFLLLPRTFQCFLPLAANWKKTQFVVVSSHNRWIDTKKLSIFLFLFSRITTGKKPFRLWNFVAKRCSQARDKRTMYNQIDSVKKCRFFFICN